MCPGEDRPPKLHDDEAHCDDRGMCGEHRCFCGSQRGAWAPPCPAFGPVCPCACAGPACPQHGEYQSRLIARQSQGRIETVRSLPRQRRSVGHLNAGVCVFVPIVQCTYATRCVCLAEITSSQVSGDEGKQKLKDFLEEVRPVLAAYWCPRESLHSSFCILLCIFFPCRSSSCVYRSCHDAHSYPAMP